MTGLSLQEASNHYPDYPFDWRVSHHWTKPLPR